LAELPQKFTDWFASRDWTPHPQQQAMLAAAEDGAHTLLTAPTGGGKTLAGFLPTLVDLDQDPIDGLHTLYISPLKALAVDIHRNLEQPVQEMGLPIRIETRTGDTPASKRARQREKPPQLLMTTPESLALMVSYEDADKLFQNLKSVVIDEAHALAGTKRGDQLALCVARLQKHAPALRRVGLSATIAHPDALRSWLAPGGDAEAVRLLTGGGGTDAEIRILSGTDLPWAGHYALHAVEAVYEAIKGADVSIIFVNTRAQAELVFGELWRHNRDGLAIGLHHGSLAVEQRRKVEAAMAAGSLRAVVCTSSLDLGIDWGDVDLVIQIGAPKGVSRLLQRIGRANHRLDEPSRAVVVPANRFEVLECLAAQEAMAINQALGTAAVAVHDVSELDDDAFDGALHHGELSRARVEYDGGGGYAEPYGAEYGLDARAPGELASSAHAFGALSDEAYLGMGGEEASYEEGEEDDDEGDDDEEIDAGELERAR